MLATATFWRREIQIGSRLFSQITHVGDVPLSLIQEEYQVADDGNCIESCAFETCSVRNIQLHHDENVAKASLDIENTHFKLSYNSLLNAVTPSQKVTVDLLGPSYPRTLWHLEVQLTIQGHKFVEHLEPEVNLKWTFDWTPTTNVYGQKVAGPSFALLKVGYKFTDCSRVFWDSKVIEIKNPVLKPRHFYGWKLNFQHLLDPANLILYTDELHDLKQKVPVVQDVFELDPVDADQIPVSITTDGFDMLYIGSNTALHQVNTSDQSVSGLTVFSIFSSL